MSQGITASAGMQKHSSKIGYERHQVSIFSSILKPKESLTRNQLFQYTMPLAFAHPLNPGTLQENSRFGFDLVISRLCCAIKKTNSHVVTIHDLIHLDKQI